MNNTIIAIAVTLVIGVGAWWYMASTAVTSAQPANITASTTAEVAQ